MQTGCSRRALCHQLSQWDMQCNSSSRCTGCCVCHRVQCPPKHACLSCLSFHKPTPSRIRQLLAGKLGEGVFGGCDPLRTVPRSLHDTRRLAADLPSAVRVPGHLFLLDQQNLFLLACPEEPSLPDRASSITWLYRAGWPARAKLKPSFCELPQQAHAEVSLQTQRLCCGRIFQRRSAERRLLRIYSSKAC